MKNKIENKIGYLVAGSMLIGSLFVIGTAFAASPGFDGRLGLGGHVPGVFGTVSAVNGNTLTVTSKGFGQNATPTTYNVDATNATVIKSGVSSFVSNIAVGDTVMVQGTVSGTNVIATTIRDGMMGRGGMGRRMGQGQKAYTNVTSLIKGNGQPVIGGNVTVINGSMINITNKSNVTYTVDATNATVKKGNTASSISAIVVGDNIIVQGTVNGNAVVASNVIDQTKPANTTTTAGEATAQPHQGFFAGIGSFFAHIFGF